MTYNIYKLLIIVNILDIVTTYLCFTNISSTEIGLVVNVIKLTNMGYVVFGIVYKTLFICLVLFIGYYINKNIDEPYMVVVRSFFMYFLLIFIITMTLVIGNNIYWLFNGEPI